MPVLDWIFLAVLLVSLLLGLWRGLVYELISVASWLTAFVLAQWFAADAAKLLPMSGASEVLRYGAGFVLVFIGSVFVGAMVAVLVRKLVSAVGLSPADRALGAAFGMVRGILLLLAVAVVVGMSPLRTNQWWQESVGAGLATFALKGLKPVLPADLGKYLS